MDQSGAGMLIVLKLCFVVFVYCIYRQFKTSNIKFRKIIWKYAKNVIAFIGAFLVANNLAVIVPGVNLIDLLILVTI
jgi:hypothetical protein